MTLNHHKKVQFSNEKDTIAYTHSATDYDRSPFAGASLQLQAFRAQLLIPQHAAPITPPPPVIHPTKRVKAHLKINTTTLACGPLFFTALSTNYSRLE
ncbi:hypothetical protein INT47_013172 [Mucor saturninus]|uniref:Uncharacterized protein n=1 Tax=Mucor saturninus TaxID=64648 RepID=A0A8H7QWG1_9FUNG|nr:hypothetical protein INT47_013172 [Mucor saturninus]